MEGFCQWKIIFKCASFLEFWKFNVARRLASEVLDFRDLNAIGGRCFAYPRVDERCSNLGYVYFLTCLVSAAFFPELLIRKEEQFRTISLRAGYYCKSIGLEQKPSSVPISRKQNFTLNLLHLNWQRKSFLFGYWYFRPDNVWISPTRSHLQKKLINSCSRFPSFAEKKPRSSCDEDGIGYFLFEIFQSFLACFKLVLRVINPALSWSKTYSLKLESTVQASLDDINFIFLCKTGVETNIGALMDWIRNWYSRARTT